MLSIDVRAARVRPTDSETRWARDARATANHRHDSGLPRHLEDLSPSIQFPFWPIRPQSVTVAPERPDSIDVGIPTLDGVVGIHMRIPSASDTLVGRAWPYFDTPSDDFSPDARVKAAPLPCSVWPLKDQTEVNSNDSG